MKRRSAQMSMVAVWAARRAIVVEVVLVLVRRIVMVVTHAKHLHEVAAKVRCARELERGDDGENLA